MAEEEALRRARRPPPERAWQDDRLRLLGAAEAGRARVDSASLGRADRGCRAAPFFDASRARARRAARRPVRAGASREAGARPGAQGAARMTRFVVDADVLIAIAA